MHVEKQQQASLVRCSEIKARLSAAWTRRVGAMSLLMTRFASKHLRAVHSMSDHQPLASGVATGENLRTGSSNWFSERPIATAALCVKLETERCAAGKRE